MLAYLRQAGRQLWQAAVPTNTYMAILRPSKHTSANLQVETLMARITVCP